MRRMAARRWRSFTLFGVNRQERFPSMWGQRVGSFAQSASGFFSGTRRSQLRKMVRQHAYHEEMRLQLRDERIVLHYSDAFGAEGLHATWMIRVFSTGAAWLEYLKLAISVYTFLLSLTIASFWQVFSSREFVWDAGVDLCYAVCLAVQLRTTCLQADSVSELCNPSGILRRHFVAGVFVAYLLDIGLCHPCSSSWCAFFSSC